MFQLGDKLQLRKIDCIVEIRALYPSGQARQKEDEFEVLIDGQMHRFSLTVLKKIFEPLDDVKFFQAIKEASEETTDVDEISEEEFNEATKNLEPEEQEIRRRGRPKKTGN